MLRPARGCVLACTYRSASRLVFLLRGYWLDGRTISGAAVSTSVMEPQSQWAEPWWCRVGRAVLSRQSAKGLCDGIYDATG